MSYLLDKKTKRKKYLKYSVFIFVFLLLVYFGVLRGFSVVTHFIFRPVLILGNSIGEKSSGISAYFSSKKNLAEENADLKERVALDEARMSNYESILNENLEIKEILGRKDQNKDMVLAGILSKPNRSLYDTLIIDRGESAGIVKDSRVFALGDIPIGRVSEVYQNSALVTLYSSPGEKTSVYVPLSLAKNENSLETEKVIHNTFMEAIGRGGGNFEMILLRDFVLEKGAEVVLPGITPLVLSKVETIISDPRDSFQKALLVSPVNIQEIKFVQVEK